MQLERLALTDFRNYRHCVWEPSTPINILTGENGSGKTNLLEAVSLLSPGRGLRSAAISLLNRQGAKNWGIAATFRRELERRLIATGSDPSGSPRRVFRLDDENVRSQSEIGQIFSCVWLTPQMDRLFVESASGRRRFLDRLVLALTPDHARQIAAHERSVSSRNRILMERPNEHLWLTSIEESIARHAVAATAARLTLTERMNEHPFGNEAFPQSMIQLDCPIASLLDESPALSVEDWIRGKLLASRTEDRQKGSTSVGAHRTDFLLYDRISRRRAHISSSGQQKAMLLGLILGHAALIGSLRGTPPMILLDEPLLHLDEARRNALLGDLVSLQAPVMLTGTDAEPFNVLKGVASFISVREGHLKPT